jgi:hypothetical protein
MDDPAGIGGSPDRLGTDERDASRAGLSSDVGIADQCGDELGSRRRSQVPAFRDR